MTAFVYSPLQRTDIPLVPFTFPTILFCDLAKQLGYSISWGDADKIWGLYRDARDAGAANVDDFLGARDYVVSRGVNETTATAWFKTAKEAATKWWGQGSYFRDFGAKGGFFGAVGGLLQGAGEAIGAATKTLINGISDGLGIPKWIVWVSLAILLVLAVYFLWKTVVPSVRLK